MPNVQAYFLFIPSEEIFKSETNKTPTLLFNSPQVIRIAVNMEFNWTEPLETRKQVRQPLQIQIRTVYYYSLQCTVIRFLSQ